MSACSFKCSSTRLLSSEAPRTGCFGTPSRGARGSARALDGRDMSVQASRPEPPRPAGGAHAIGLLLALWGSAAGGGRDLHDFECICLCHLGGRQPA